MDGCIDLTAEASDDEGPVRPSARRLPAHSLERQGRDLAAAIAASFASSAPPPTTMQASAQGGSTRLEMEKERLARQSKRTAEGASSSLAKASVESPHKRRHIHSLADLVPSSSSSSSPSSSVSPVKSDSRLSRRTDVRYWKGDVKQVQNQFHPDSPLGSMSFADVVGPVDELEHAVLSSFAIDMDWVVPHFTANPNVNLLIVKGADPSQGPGIFSSTTPKVYALVPQPGKTATGTPMKQGINHIKFVVLCYKSFLRIVISSANAVDYDYDLMDNSLFIHDFPKCSTPQGLPDPRTNTTHSSAFSLPFLDLLFRLGVPKKFTNPFATFDFSASCTPDSPRLVVSNQGTWSGWSEIREGGGIVSLASAVADLGLDLGKGGNMTLEVAGSSIGKYTAEWFAQFLGACEGISPQRFFLSTNSQPLTIRTKDVNAFPIKILFHTDDEVTRSRGGQAGGGTIFLPKSTWNSSGFPQGLFYRNVSRRKGVLAHTKTIVALSRPGPNSAADFIPCGWFYLGSHNFTGAAWGRLSWVKSGKDVGPRLTVNNFELGVVLPLRGGLQEMEKRASELVSYVRPVHQYDRTDLPWSQEGI